jgi:hypothetical protein
MKLKLNSGREIKLADLRQFRTYGGVLCGVPTPQRNAEFVEDALKEASEVNDLGLQPVLIPPKAGTWMPKVTSLALFDSGEPPESPDAYSSVAVVWYQEEFGLPTDKAVLDGLAAIDWEAHSKGWMP